MGAISTTINLNDGLTSVIQNMFKSVNYLNDALQSTDELVKGSFDNTALNAARESMAKAVASAGILENSIRELSNTSNAAKSSFEWSSISTMPTFDTSGIQRARQEFSALESSVLKVSETQNKLTQEISGMNLLPKNAIQEINIVNSRISSISSTIAKLEKEKNKLGSWNTSGINAYNSKIESLREKMFQAEKEQEAINRAVKDNNTEKINASYSRLVSIIGSAEGEIKKNTTAQNNFNSSLATGTNSATNLSNKLSGISGKLMGYASMIAGGLSIKAGIDNTDTYTNNSSRLALITKNLDEQKALQNDIYKSAMRSRGVYNDMVDITAKLGLLAGDAFKDNKELVKFNELMNKSFKLSGAGTQERQAGMYQLTQAMASGRLQGDEFRSIIENAPMLANAIAKYTGVGMDGLKEMSKEGTISASIIKNSLFSAANDIEAKYATMPMTFGDIFNQIKSTATVMLGSIFENINDKINSDGFQEFVNKIYEGLNWVSLKATEFISWINQMAIVVGPNLSLIGSSFMQVGNYIFSASGFLGGFKNALMSIGSSQGFRKTMSILGGTFMTVARFAQWCASSLASLNERVSWLLPTVTTAIIAFKIFQGTNSVLQSVISGVGNAISTVTQYTSAMAQMAKVATSAQQGLNMAMNANPYYLVASAIATVVSAIASLVGAMKVLNQAAGISSNVSTTATADEIRFAKSQGISVSAAQSYFSTKKSYDDSATQMSKDIYEHSKTLENLENKAIKLNALSNVKGIPQNNAELERIKASMREEQNLINELKDNRKVLREQQGKDLASIKDSDKERQRMMKELQGLNVDEFKVEAPEYSDVGKVGEVEKVGGTVDIASEDLKYLRDIAEQEAINQFTTKMVVPDVKITFTGDIKETADVGVISEAVKENIISELNSGAEFAHA